MDIADSTSTLPDRLYFTISEVSEHCGLEPHVLRYWEQEFSELKPMKRTGNRRYYQKKDIFLIKYIKKLLYEEGFTIEGARKILTSSRNDFSQKEHRLREVLNIVIGNLEKLVKELES